MALTPDQYAGYIAGEDFSSLTGVGTTQEPKRGDDIFEGTDYPREWSGFVGQERAIEQLMIQIASANARSTRLEHTLLSSGTHGIGKTTLAKLIAAQANVGILEVSGQIDVEQARALLKNMQDGDILFWEEFHTAVLGGRSKADWLLPFMTEARLYTSSGAIDMPDVTIVAATTDAGRLPQTILSRFMVQPELVPYTPDEGAQIAASLAGRIGAHECVTLIGAKGRTKRRAMSPDDFRRIAVAADYNPRAMRQILTGVRDLAHARPDSYPNLETAFDWAKVSADGLTVLAREILIILLTAKDNTASIETIKAQLGEPGPLKHEEQTLLRRSLITITGRGRQLTDTGRNRAIEELTKLREQHAATV